MTPSLGPPTHFPECFLSPPLQAQWPRPLRERAIRSARWGRAQRPWPLSQRPEQPPSRVPQGLPRASPGSLLSADSPTACTTDSGVGGTPPGPHEAPRVIGHQHVARGLTVLVTEHGEGAGTVHRSTQPAPRVSAPGVSALRTLLWSLRLLLVGPVPSSFPLRGSWVLSTKSSGE